MRALLIGVATLALFASAASTAMAQNGLPTGGQLPVAGGAAGGGYGYGYGYAAAPLYDYAAPSYGYAAPSYGYAAPSYGYAAPSYGYAAPSYGYAAPAYVVPGTARTVVIVTPGVPAYTAPPVASGYYNYAPGYWGGYRGWRAGW
jgi:hypothetical protein